MNKIDQIRHRAQQRKPRGRSYGFVCAVSPADEQGLDPGALGGGDIDCRIPAKDSLMGPRLECGKRKERSGWIGLPRAVGRAANDRGEVMVEGEVAKNFFAQKLRFIRADGQGYPDLSQLPEGSDNTRKGQAARNVNDPMARSELFEVGCGVDRVWAHDRCDHRSSANSVHFSDKFAIRRLGDAALSKHLVNDGARELGTINQRPVEIEDDVFVNHFVRNLNYAA